MDMIIPVSRLVRVFGPDSQGESPEERALTSSRLFVRSQDHLAVEFAKATGHRLTAWEAFQAFGFERLEEVFDYGSAILVSDPREPAATIRRRRETLELDLKDVARAAGVSSTKVGEAENPNKRNSIKVLERIAATLGLDELRLGGKQEAGADEHLALRLRQMKHLWPDFGPSAVLKFAEAAWVTRKQALLSEWLGGPPNFRILGFEPDSRFGDRSCPAWQFGYELAHTARNLLSLSEEQPIYLRDLVERRLQISLVHLSLPVAIAGATISTGQVRGIAVNSVGHNANVWVRRTTIAHELGHLLWDPDQNLKSLVVDMFQDFEEPPEFKHDAVEARANAFAVEFLAPRARALEIYRRRPELRDGLRAVMEHFGVSFTTAKLQIWNALDRKMPLELFAVDDVEPTDEWKGSGSFAMDYFKPSSVQDSRRGRFAGLVVRSMRKRIISECSAALFLGCTEQELRDGAILIEQIYGVEV